MAHRNRWFIPWRFNNFNIAMENGPFIDDVPQLEPLLSSIYNGFSIAMLVITRGYRFFKNAGIFRTELRAGRWSRDPLVPAPQIPTTPNLAPDHGGQWWKISDEKWWSGWWLSHGCWFQHVSTPLKKYESQLGWWKFPKNYMEKYKIVQTTN